MSFHLHEIAGQCTRPQPLLPLVAAFVLAALPALAPADVCVVPDNGSGTVDLPPAGCGYVSPTDLHLMIDGLPAGTTIRVDANHNKFFNVVKKDSAGGQDERFDSILLLNMTGTGALAGFHRNLLLQPSCRTHTGAHAPGNPVQSFATEMLQLQGQLPPGDPDFDLLRITAGTDFGMPSPGHTTLIQTPSGNWNVDSFFDITYRIDFVGAPGGPLAGRSGSTLGTVRMRAGQPQPDACVVAGNGAGSVDLPPQGCGYVSPEDLHRMIDGLPPGTTIEVAAKHDRFFNITRTPLPGGGESESFNSNLGLVLRGTGDLSGLARLLSMQVQCMTRVAPHTTGVVQSFDTEMLQLQGQITGDPDFDLLRITAGTDFGLPSPGHTTLRRQSTGQWAVDSFFDITYRIDFVGKPGGSLSGMSGSTTGTIRMRTGHYLPTDVEQIPVPKKTALQPNVPNPFNPSTTIHFDIATGGRVRLEIVDISGRVVRTLIDASMEPKHYAFIWNGRDDQGGAAPSGNYFVRLAGPDGADSRSITLIK